MESVVTSDLAEFGWRERKMAAELLTAMTEQGLPEDFGDDHVGLEFNKHSGCVFIVNAEYDVAMMNGEKLETWYSCPICGHEGFAENMAHNEDDKDCQEWLIAIGLVEVEPEA